MLNRQKSILSLLHHAGGEAGRKQLVKWCFLASRETETGGPSYYDFVPFLYGPYSFTLKHEVDKLIRNGLVREPRPKRWGLTARGRALVASFPHGADSGERKMIRRYGRLAEEDLLDSVYDRYRWFTINSRRPGKRLAERPTAEPAVYSAGYEGKSVESFLNGLVRAGVWALVDVRHNPIARRFGFHKGTLARLCGHLGIAYTHVRELGIPSSLRSKLDTRQDYLRLLARYEEEILPANRDALLRLAESAAGTPTAVMCMEDDHTICHRSRVAASLALLTGLGTIHLKGGTDDRVPENARPDHGPDLSPSIA